MADAPTSLDWEHVLAQERAAIREPDGRHDGPNRPLTGLAFSGGGIRSATFNLGVTQALAELKLLRQFDYLSCVSGGGYVGGWLSAFIHRECNGRVEDAERALQTGGSENSAIRFLRSYSNYLTPKASLFSADTLTGVATYLRNLHINFPMLLLTLSSFLLLPRLLVWFARWLVGWEGENPAANVSLLPIFVAGVACAVISILFIGLNLDSHIALKSRPIYTRQAGVLTLVVAPALLSAWFIAFGFYIGAGQLDQISLGAWMLWGILFYEPPWLFGWGLGLLLGRSKYERPKFAPGNIAMMAISTVLAGALGGVLLAIFAEVMKFIREIGQGYSGSWIASALGTAALLYFYSLTVVGHIALMGRYFSSDALEWWSRLGGWLLVVAAIWMSSFCLTFFAPAFFLWVDESFTTFVLLAAILWVGLFATAYVTPSKFDIHSLTGFMSTLLGILKKPSNKAMEVWYALVASYIPYVVVVGLLGVLSVFLHELLMQPAFCSGCVRHPATPSLLLDTLYQDAAHFQYPNIIWVASLFAGSLTVAMVLASRIDINRFSLHDFFRQRLVRCYLGASRSKLRSPHPFTGFDPRDDIKLAELCSLTQGKTQCQRPCLIHNTAMNLVAGKQLAWQERRAVAFSFTPMATGYSFNLPDEKGHLLSHYRPTSQYMNGVWMGSAMAISGAAASPNMGYHSSPALTFLMTVFNVRLGHWSPNPADNQAWTLHAPPFGSFYLLKELFGQTQHTSPFVYLSDGGHFENLGIYELVRRRCACIVTIDVSEDSNHQFEDLGKAINKCYTDFGVVIDIHAEDLKSRYSAVGRITYPDARTATLIYIKPLLTGTEPADLLICKSTHRGFPHESTVDQGFDEAEFEGYRKLGHYIGKAVFETALIEANQRQDVSDDWELTLPRLCEILREQGIGSS